MSPETTQKKCQRASGRNEAPAGWQGKKSRKAAPTPGKTTPKRHYLRSVDPCPGAPHDIAPLRVLATDEAPELVRGFRRRFRSDGREPLPHRGGCEGLVDLA